MYAALAIDWLRLMRGPAWLPSWHPERRARPRRCSAPRDAADVTPRLQARADGDGWRVSGVADFVADADLADMIVVTAEADGRTVGFVVDTTATRRASTAAP